MTETGVVAERVEQALVQPQRPPRRTHRSTVLAVSTLGLIVGYAVLVPLLAPDHLMASDFTRVRLGPSWRHWFGTDYAGHDLFVRIAAGLRVSLLIAASCALVSVLLGLAVGTIAATMGRLVDAILMRTSDGINALPHLLLGIVVVSMFRGSIPAIILSIALTHWPMVARIVRSEALTVRGMEYVDAAYVAGANKWQVLRRHILPATLGQAAVAVVLLLPHAIWHESTLSFLGLGLSPDQPSLGTLLQTSSGEILVGGWWTLVFPSIALIITTLAVSGLATWLQRRWLPVSDVEVEL